MKFGELLSKEGVITPEQLQEALELQKDNAKVPLGEILLTQGILTREQVLYFIEKMIFLTGEIPQMEMEMLDQEEIDVLMAKHKQEQNKP